jgi:hypothetical protein
LLACGVGTSARQRQLSTPGLAAGGADATLAAKKNGVGSMLVCRPAHLAGVCLKFFNCFFTVFVHKKTPVACRTAHLAGVFLLFFYYFFLFLNKRNTSRVPAGAPCW